MIKGLEIRGKHISYSDNGEGNTIVLLHGFLEDKGIWNRYSQVLKKDFRVIAVDLPGFGDSEILDKVHSMDIMADVVISILRKEGIKYAIFAGHSMGGYVSLAIAKKNIEMVKGLILINSQASADDEITKINRDRTIKIVQNDHSRFIAEFIPSLFKEDNIIKYNDEIELLTQTSLATSDASIIAALKGMKTRDESISLLEVTDIPILFIIGKHDSKIPLERMKDQILLPKISEALILENVGHMAFIEEEELCLRTIQNFTKKYFNE